MYAYVLFREVSEPQPQRQQMHQCVRPGQLQQRRALQKPHPQLKRTLRTQTQTHTHTERERETGREHK